MNSRLQYPTRHISVRVPWHDNGWNGTVCTDPRNNSACLKLPQIAENKDEGFEAKLAGRPLKGLTDPELPPCLRERAGFMSPDSLVKLHTHPYQRNQDTHGHFRPTPVTYPPYSVPTVPFRWMRKDAIPELSRHCPMDGVEESQEPSLSFKPSWWQDYRNQSALLNKFWSHVQPETSLVFFYAKQVPIAEEVPGRRVLIGVGRVTKVFGLKEYDYHAARVGSHRSMVWERMMEHSVRPDFRDGFLMPYHHALSAAMQNADFDPAEIIALTPEDRFTEFSYGSEHVSDDTAIEALHSMRSSLMRSADLFGQVIRNQEAWIDQQISRLWDRRGPFPGMGVVLQGMGVPMGNFIAKALGDLTTTNQSPWSIWYSILDAPHDHLPQDLANCIDPTIAQAWKSMPTERRAFLELLSRIDLTPEQAEYLVTPEGRSDRGLTLQDSELLENPYSIYEATRLTTFPVSLSAVDRGVLPSGSVRGTFEASGPTRIDTPLDARRLRALAISELEKAALQGSTLLPKADIIANLRSSDKSELELQTLVTSDVLRVAEQQCFEKNIRTLEMSDGDMAYQLERLGESGDRIRRLVERRIGAKRHGLKIDWRREVDREFGDLPADPVELEDEESARIEKSKALEEIANSRFSVLIGSAGTGKTTLLSILCSRPEIRERGVVLLAPTGKARVRMAELINPDRTNEIRAFTLAQFLIRSGRYLSETQRYTLTGEPGSKSGGTVIVDECSMLTEEMLATLIESLVGFDRLIMVGDPRQLPPIGAGRPFVDIVFRVKPSKFDPGKPRVGPSYAELTVPRRQGVRSRDDLELASWFGGEPNASNDSVFEILARARSSNNIRIYTWDSVEDLKDKLPSVLAEELGFDQNADQTLEFAKSLGGAISGPYAYFNINRSGKAAEDWQILTPSKHTPWGVEPLNRQIHQIYKASQIQAATTVPRYKHRRFLKPQGDQLIVYGDKVINTKNRPIPKQMRFPEGDGYLANGEVGIVVGQMRTRKFPYPPSHLEIEFSTQTGSVVKFPPSQFDDESQANLELAYALTIHRSQGSEFETVFLVMPASNRMLSRELLYTALTRQRVKIVLLLQGSLVDLQRLSSEQHSETARRLTNLFAPPKPVKVGDSFLEERLIHRTERGEAVRSKSEVIIANLLYARGLPYRYEEPLEIDSVVKYPDFTIDDDDTGETYFWEHLGLLGNDAYRRGWELKRQWYDDHGVAPIDVGGGHRGNLIVTEDSKDGGIDSQSAGRLIDEIFGT